MTTTARNGSGPILGMKKPPCQAALSEVPLSRDHSTHHEDNTEQGPLDHLRTYSLLLTPLRAQFIIDHQMWPRQRLVRPAHVSYLASAIELGEMTTISLIFAELPDQRRYLIDGQHRLHALLQANTTLPCSVAVHKVADEDAVSRLYLTIDRQATRTALDGIRAFGIGGDLNTSPTILNRIGRGVTLAETGFSRTSRQNKSLIWRTNAVQNWLPEGLRYAEHLAGVPHETQRLLWRGPVVAVAVVTLRHSSFADEFWSRAASGEMLTADDPRSRLMVWLRSHRVADLGNEVVYARHVAVCWNAFVEGRMLKIVKVQDPSAPIRLVGTPYTGNGAP